MKLLNGEIVKRYNDLNLITGLEGVKLLYAVMKNKQALKRFAEELDENIICPKSDSYLEYERKFSILTSNKQNIPYKEILELETEYKSHIDNRIKDVKEYNKLMLQSNENDISIFYIPLSLCPTQQDQFNALEFMIVDMTPEQELKFNELFNSLMK